MRKRLFSIAFLFVCAFGVSYFGLQLALWGLCDTFSLKSIRSAASEPKKWRVHNTRYPQEIFSQPYHYLGKGSQFYVFASEDDRFVIKFFRHNRFHHPKLPGLPSFMRTIQEERIAEKHKRQEQLFSSCHLAFSELRKECGLLYMHLTKEPIGKTLLVHDAVNRPYRLNLDELDFYIQKKGEPLIKHLRERPYEALYEISSLLIRRFEKGIDDYDPVLQNNTGFCGVEPLFLDIGSFYRNPSLKRASHYEMIYAMTRKLKPYTSDPSAIDEALLPFAPTK